MTVKYIVEIPDALNDMILQKRQSDSNDDVTSELQDILIDGLAGSSTVMEAWLSNSDEFWVTPVDNKEVETTTK